MFHTVLGIGLIAVGLGWMLLVGFGSLMSIGFGSGFEWQMVKDAALGLIPIAFGVLAIWWW